MGLINYIKSLSWRKKISAFIKDNKRNPILIPFSSAKKIGLYYSYVDETSYRAIVEFIAYLHKNGSEVTSLILINQSKEKQMFQSITNQLILDKSSSSSSKLSSNQTVQTFTNTPFDIYIDLSPTAHPQSLYISYTSKAHLKIGKYENKAFDICIYSNSENTKVQLEDIIKYMSILTENTPQK